MEIAPNVHRIHCGFGDNRMVYVHLLVGKDASLLVDTACAHNPEQDIVPYMESIGFDPADLDYVVVSHSDLDHQGGNGPMKEQAPGARLMCHRFDQPWIDSTEALIEGRYSQFEGDHGIGYDDATKDWIRNTTQSLPVDMTLQGGETIRLSAGWSVEIMHTPGHTWGHLAVYDPASKCLIAGEASLWTTILDDDWNPALPPTYCYIDTYLATQNRLLSMDIETLSPSHWPVQKGQDVKTFIQESKNYCEHVENKLLALARHHPITLKQAIDELASDLGEWSDDVNEEFAYGMLGNLQHLTKRRFLSAGRNENGHVEWTAKGS